MDDRRVTYVENAEQIIGYKVKIMPKPVFQVTGYTMIVPPKAAAQTIPPFVAGVTADGRLDALRRASPVPTWILGLGSFDEECHPDEWRYTICIERTERADFRRLAEQYPLHTQRFEKCDWMCFEISQQRFLGELKLFSAHWATASTSGWAFTSKPIRLITTSRRTLAWSSGYPSRNKPKTATSVRKRSSVREYSHSSSRIAPCVLATGALLAGRGRGPRAAFPVHSQRLVRNCANKSLESTAGRPAVE